MKKGFTLIELLIVVAIIAILAAIAVPNFLEAQTRAKVSRVKADLRTLATAIESYNVDFNKPAPQSSSAGNGPFHFIPDPNFPGYLGTGTLTYAITTPIAYITNFMFFDPFVANSSTIHIDAKLYTYQAYQWKWREIQPGGTGVADSTTDPNNEQFDGNTWKQVYGAWKLLSIAPDRDFYNGNGGAGHRGGYPYDPTNGTVSWGNITRSQKESDQKTFVP